MKTGLVLEGGGMRGLYTAGVLDFFLSNNIEFDYCVGVSAGACNAVSYLAKQYGRNKRININYINDKRYLSLNNFIRTKSLFGMDFLFNEIPKTLEVFNYESFRASKCEYYAGVTDVVKGESVYFSKDEVAENIDILRASSSIPLFSPIVEFGGGKYLDGGTADPIPIRKAIEDGCDKVVVVLTQTRDYVKSPEGFSRLYRHMLKKYPNMINVLNERHNVYNDSLEYVKQLEKEGKALVIAPSEINVKRFERSKESLTKLYDLGFKEAKNSPVENFLKTVSS